MFGEGRDKMHKSTSRSPLRTRRFASTVYLSSLSNLFLVPSSTCPGGRAEGKSLFPELPYIFGSRCGFHSAMANGVPHDKKRGTGQEDPVCFQGHMLRAWTARWAQPQRPPGRVRRLWQCHWAGSVPNPGQSAARVCSALHGILNYSKHSFLNLRLLMNRPHLALKSHHHFVY